MVNKRKWTNFRQIGLSSQLWQPVKVWWNRPLMFMNVHQVGLNVILLPYNSTKRTQNIPVPKCHISSVQKKTNSINRNGQSTTYDRILAKFVVVKRNITLLTIYLSLFCTHITWQITNRHRGWSSAAFHRCQQNADNNHCEGWHSEFPVQTTYGWTPKYTLYVYWSNKTRNIERYKTCNQ